MQGAGPYYTRFFIPLASDAVIWLLATCRGAFSLERRELAMRCQGSHGTWWLRNRVYRSVSEVEEALRQECVLSLEFGGIFPGHHLEDQPLEPPPLWAGEANRYDHRPRDFARSKAAPAEAACIWGEMVLDVDLEHDPLDPDKYDRSVVCDCGAARRVCDDCWEAFMRPAQSALLWAARFLGFERVLCVFSGRRGFHLWLCDERATRMTQPERIALVERLRRPPATRDAFSDGMYAVLAPAFDAHPVLSARFDQSKSARHRADAHREAVFAALWPRIDVPVAADPSHMHKAPLSLHPETGAVCVVMGDPDTASERFVPSQDTFLVHDVDERLLRAVVAGCATRIAKLVE